MGNWKLTWRRRGEKWELYDLKADRSETEDLSDQHPEKVNTMAARWQATLDGFVKDLAATGEKDS